MTFHYEGSGEGLNSGIMIVLSDTSLIENNFLLRHVVCYELL